MSLLLKKSKSRVEHEVTLICKKEPNTLSTNLFREIGDSMRLELFGPTATFISPVVSIMPEFIRSSENPLDEKLPILFCDMLVLPLCCTLKMRTPLPTMCVFRNEAAVSPCAENTEIFCPHTLIETVIATNMNIVLPILNSNLYRFAGGVAGGEGYLEVVAAGVGVEVE